MVLGTTALATGALWVASAGLAFAEKGVHFDPDSPAGKEYALPLDQARDEATGGGNPEGTGREEESGESAPLFGEGLSRGPGEAAAVRGSGGTEGGDEPPPGGPGGDRGPGEIDTGGGVGAAATLGYDDDGYSLLSGALLVIVIALLGVGLGFGLRGLQRIRPS
jgi:hypothetical protein